MANYKLIGEHTVDIDLLPEFANILDGGCRGMYLDRAFEYNHYNVYSIDIDNLKHEGYIRCGLSHKLGWGGISNHADPQARQLIDGDYIPIHTVESLKKLLDIDYWDLIKLDIEGAEFEILKQAQHPIAKQVSVEFHIHCGQTKEQIDELLEYLSQWYDIPVKVFEARHGLPANYWDVLLVDKTCRFTQEYIGGENYIQL